jgi:hypothetical protein
VGGKSTIEIVSGHLLAGTHIASARAAQVADATWDDSWDEDVLPHPHLGTFACIYDPATDLMAEYQRKRGSCLHGAVEEPEVGVAQAASGDLDENLACFGRSAGMLDPLK